MKKKFRASVPTLWGHHIKAEGDSRVQAVVALNKVARLTGTRVNFSQLVVKTR